MQNPDEHVLARFNLPHTQVCVRIIRESDLRALEWHGGADLRGFYRELWEKHYQNEITMMVADFQNFPIGLAAIYWHGKNTHPDIPDLQSLRVLPVFRGQGIGSRLLQISEKLVQKSNHHQISLSVSIENSRAKKLYERLGYVVTGEPYLSEWDYKNARGKTVHVEETVLDLVKDLK